MGYQVRLKVAEAVLQIISRDRGPIAWIEQNFTPFLSRQKPQMVVSCRCKKVRRRRQAPFQAASVTKEGQRLFYPGEQFEATIDFARQEAQFVSGPNPDMTVLLRFLCSLILARTGGLLLHASAILHHERAHVFFGPSGSGKTTVAGLSGGRAVLTDETCALIRKNGSWFAYATPFAGEFGQPLLNTGGPVRALFALNKGTRFSHRTYKPGSAARELSYSTLLHNADVNMIDQTLASLEQLARDVPCYELYFKAQPRLWRYIDGFVL